MNKKKILIYGTGLTSLIIKNLIKSEHYELYEILSKKNYVQSSIHPHVFSSVFLKFFSKYVIKTNIFKKKFREEIFLKLEKNIKNKKIKKINFENFDINFKKDKVILIDKERDIKEEFDIFLDCGGASEKIKKKLENKLETLILPKKTTLISFHVKVHFNFIKSKFYENNSFYLKNFNLTILNQKKNIYSFTFVSEYKIDKNFCKRFLSKFLSKKKYEIIKSMKWVHTKSHFIYPKQEIKSYMPVGDTMMKTDPQHGLGASLGLFQCIYISQNLDNENFDYYFSKYKSFFNKIEKKKTKILKRKKINVLFRLMPFYNEVRLLYYFKNQKKLFSEILDLID